MNKEKENAENRTDWAEDRTQLANERTFAAWLRTGMACVAVALGLEAIFKDFEPTWMAKAVSCVFIAIGIFVFIAARHQSLQTQKRLNTHAVSNQSSRHVELMSIFLIIGAFAVGVLLWLL